MSRTGAMKPVARPLIAVLLGVGILSFPAVAQHEGHANKRGMEARGAPAGKCAPEMHHKTGHRGSKTHSANLLRHATMKALVLPALSDTLGLSDDQTARLKELRDALRTEQENRREELRSQKKTVHEFVETDRLPDPATVRDAILARSTTRAELNAAAYETAIEMRQVLTPSQRERLDALSRRALHRTVTANLTRKERMRTMKMVHGPRGESVCTHRSGHASSHSGRHSKRHKSKTGKMHGDMPHREHGGGSGTQADHRMKNSGRVPLQKPGQPIFGTVQEAIRALERDPSTDWSDVDVDRLRRHLLDMQNVATHVRVLDKKPIENGIRLTVRGTTDSARASLRRVLAAHPRMLKREVGWDMDVSGTDARMVLRVTDPTGRAVEKIRALGYMGLLAYGTHHRRHHWMLLRGKAPHSH